MLLETLAQDPLLGNLDPYHCYRWQPEIKRVDDRPQHCQSRWDQQDDDEWPDGEEESVTKKPMDFLLSLSLAC